MALVAIVAIAVAILVYFSFSGGKPDIFAETDSQLIDDKGEASVTDAVVKNKYITEDGRKRKHYLVYMAVFECDDGEEREFFVDRDVFDEIKIGDRAALIFSGNIFLGFGEHGVTKIVGDEADANLDGDDFSYDDFDESIDIEQTLDLPGESQLSAEDAEYFEQFNDRVKLSAKSETVEDETDSLTGYPSRDLLKKITLYPFLKRESDIVRMFERTYREAVSDMLGFDGNSRKGMAADSVFINKNEIRIVITVQECPPQLKSKITAEFGVNE